MGAMRAILACLSLVALMPAAAIAQGSARLSHRLWLLDGAPTPAASERLRSLGVRSVVVAVGDVTVGPGTARLTLGREGLDLKGVSDWSITPLVWVSGDGAAAGDAATFVSQLSVVLGGAGSRSGLVLAARAYFEGLPRFASALAKQLQRPVELALSAATLAERMPPGGWSGVVPLAVALGNPLALSFPDSTLHDDLASLDAIDALGADYRAVIVVAPRSIPAPGPRGGSLLALADAQVAVYAPGERGDRYQLRRPLDWGGVTVGAGQSIEVDAPDAVSYHRDLGHLLRPARSHLAGWDTAGLVGDGVPLGLSYEGLSAYLSGRGPVPVPEVRVQWTKPAVARVTVTNPTAFSSAAATTSNWVELRFEGSEVRDVALGQFRGVDYGRLVGGHWRRTGAGDANAVRLFMTILAPGVTLDGGTISFVAPPRDIQVRWGLRLSNGSSAVGPLVAPSS